MKTFLTGTALCIVAALVVVTVMLMDLPKAWVIAAIPVLFAGFGLQLLALWKIRPSSMLDNTVQTPNKKRGMRKFDGPRVIGLILALLGSIGAVAVGIYITHDANYLWSLILVGIVVEQIATTGAEYTWKPAVLGLVMGLLCVGLGAVIWYVKDANYLWALILIGLLTDTII